MRVLILLILSGLIFSQDKGKKAYDSGNFDEARAYYEHVLNNRKNDPNALFSLGATAYQQKDMETAAKSLNGVMNSKNSKLASKALFNLGNMFKDQEKMEESLALYRKALELDPTDEDAKVNYELLKQVLQQQQEQEQEQDKNQDSEENQNQDQESDQNKDSDEGQNEDQQDNQQSDQQDEQENQDNQNQSSSEDQQDQQEQQDQQQQSEQGKEEEKSDKQVQAEAILNALKDQEKINQKRQIAKAKSRKLEKDW